MARIRDDWDKLMELFAEVALPKDATSEAFILRTFPHEYSNKEILTSVPSFAYPCIFRCDVVTHFSFVLTNINSKWTFGYCRHTPKSDTCLVILSDLPWHSTFYRILDHCAELSTRQSSIPLERFLEALYTSDLPQPGLELNITYTCEDIKLREFKASCPDHQKLPCIPEDRNITEYFSAVSSANMISIFASMLAERRIVITSDRLNRLSSCVQAANALIYPMHWQHIFIPLLPSHLLDYLSAPMPFLIGVPQVTLAKVSRNELGDVVLLNADTNQLSSPFDDVSTLPSDVVNTLRKALKQFAALGDGLCRAFMRALVSLIGGYRAALRIVPGEQITFDKDLFVSSVRGTSKQLFLERMLQLQIFQQFIETRLDLFNAGQRVLDDQFEIELNHMESQSDNRFKAQYREWKDTMRKEGGALLRAVNPKMKSAISRSRQVVRNLRSIITTPNSVGHVQGQIQHRPTSAPSSPKLPLKIKKSISGTAISQTSRTVTYVRNPQTVSMAPSAKGYNNQLLTTTTLSSVSRKPLGNGNSSTLAPPQNTMAPSASSESSDIEEADFSTLPRVNMNITAELENIFRNRTTKDVSQQPNTNTRTSASENNIKLVVPIPPPRSDRLGNLTRHTLRPATKPQVLPIPNSQPVPPVQEKCLIEFDSPPKELPPTNSQSISSLGALVFDPLLESNYSSAQYESNDSNSTSCFKKHFNNNGHMVNAPTSSLMFLSDQPLTTDRTFTQKPTNTNGEHFSNSSQAMLSTITPQYNNTASLISQFEMLSPSNQPPPVSAERNNNPFKTHCWQEFD